MEKSKLMIMHPHASPCILIIMHHNSCSTMHHHASSCIITHHHEFSIIIRKSKSHQKNMIRHIYIYGSWCRSRFWRLFFSKIQKKSVFEISSRTFEIKAWFYIRKGPWSWFWESWAFNPPQQILKCSRGLRFFPSTLCIQLSTPTKNHALKCLKI